MEKTNKGLIYWLVVVACCGLSASSIGLCANCAGIFYTPVSTALGVGRGAFALNATLCNLATGFFSPVVAKLMGKYNIKILMIVGILLSGVSTIAMGFGGSLYAFYILGILRGIGVSFFALMPVTTIIGNWFTEKHGLATGIALSFSGLSGAIFNPVISSIIANMGWKMAYILSGIFMMALALPGVLTVLHFKPSDIGRLPYGGTEEKKKVSAGKGKSVKYISLTFILMSVMTVTHTSVTGLGQHFSGFSESIGLGAAVGAAMISAAMVGNIVTKLVIGVLSDKFGAFNASRIMITVNFLSILTMFLAPKSFTSAFIAAAFFYGSVYSVGATGIPLMVRTIYGAERYASAYSVINILTSVGSASALTIIGLIFDFTGSYYGAYAAGLVINVVNFSILMFLQRRVKSHPEQ